MAFGDDRPTVLIDEPDPTPDDIDRLAPFVQFKYGQPNVTVNTAGRFRTHEVIGDVTVRQKIGEEPDTVSVSGVCTAEEANKVDQLREKEYIEFLSNRWEGLAQVASTNTDPHSNGGTQDKDEEWLHTFNIELVEVTDVSSLD